MISQFWFHGLRNCFITVAECDLFLLLSLTKRLVDLPSLILKEFFFISESNRLFRRYFDWSAAPKVESLSVLCIILE